MARPKEFDEAEVLDKALLLFRAQGYHATSFADLTKTLGVCRQSLYDTYGDKQNLFVTALKRYIQNSSDCMRRRLDKQAPIREILASIFSQLVADNCNNGAPGCMAVNTMVELSPNADVARSIALEHARTMEGIFATRLIQAQREGEISADKDPIVLARFLFHTTIGIAVAARAFDDQRALEESGRLALLALG